jgi:ABC-type transport system involved in multi-copper enzyme maturation permease subunit
VISRGKLFYIGVLLFLAGLIVPFIIGLVVGFIGPADDTRYNILYYVFATGLFVSLGLGVPMIVAGIVMRSKRQRQE